MAKSKKKVCAECGRSHWGPNAICWQCARSAEEEENAKYCLICGSRLSRGNGIGFGFYCSFNCVATLNSARSKAARLVSKHVRTGKIPPAKECVCVDCGKQAAHYDHREYMKPLDVVPVCISCNIKRGPAIDIKQMIADHLNVNVDDLKAAVEKLKKKNLTGFRKAKKDPAATNKKAA